MLPLNELLRQQSFVAGKEPTYVDYIVFGTLQMPRILKIEPLDAQQDGVIRWREEMRKLFNGLGDSTS